mmetsp:Transcript_21244/g.45383  ORF Transcript_21244/g.45383 Transcript_21244/m.45383 type:complete len:86 (+) Transcript_21244:112-369(+)
MDLGSNNTAKLVDTSSAGVSVLFISMNNIHHYQLVGSGSQEHLPPAQLDDWPIAQEASHHALGCGKWLHLKDEMLSRMMRSDLSH